MIALGYTIIYFIRGSLPWQGLEQGEEGKSEFFEKVAAKKRQCTNYVLCQDCPAVLKHYMHYVSQLRFPSLFDFTNVKRWITESANSMGYDLED